LAREAGTRGGTAPAVFNAANEVCVQAFRDGRLPFLAIVDTVARVVTEHDVPSYEELSIDDVLAADTWARARARELTAVQETTQA
jgi:1-deoxy-D-xylulose-5-phosphate reductoisomerase